jgi:hypothetical protein
MIAVTSASTPGVAGADGVVVDAGVTVGVVVVAVVAVVLAVSAVRMGVAVDSVDDGVVRAGAVVGASAGSLATLSSSTTGVVAVAMASLNPPGETFVEEAFTVPGVSSQSAPPRISARLNRDDLGAAADSLMRRDSAAFCRAEAVFSV